MPGSDLTDQDPGLHYFADECLHFYFIEQFPPIMTIIY